MSSLLSQSRFRSLTRCGIKQDTVDIELIRAVRSLSQRIKFIGYGGIVLVVYRKNAGDVVPLAYREYCVNVMQRRSHATDR